MNRRTTLSSIGLALLTGLAGGLLIGQDPHLVGQVTSFPTPGQAGTSDSPAAGLDPYNELARDYERYAAIDHIYARVAAVVSPSVVHIEARKKVPVPGRDRGPRLVEETGSGVIVSLEERPGRYILTNHHVVEGASPDEILVTLFDGRKLRPEAAWLDPKADLAVLDLGRSDLPAARLGNSDEAVVGTWVLALGSPFGLTHSVSQGIISARNRHEQELEDEGVENQEFLQTDAAINPGNSGGPLVNLKGEVIGINSAIASNGGGNEGVGFSIPINLARWILVELVQKQRVSRGALGVRLQDLSAETANSLGLLNPQGAWILSVQSDSPAKAAGILPGDVVLRFNDVPVSSINHLINLVSMSPIGRPVEVVLWRQKAEVRLQVAVADRDDLLTERPDLPADKNVNRPPNRAEGTSRGPGQRDAP